MHAELALEIGDHAVDGGDPERVAADEEGMEAQRHADARVLHARGHMLVHGAPGAQLHQVRQDAQHVHRRAEGHMAKLFEADPVDRFALRHESVVARHVTGRQPAHLGAHPRGIAAAGEDRAVVEADRIEGIERAQLHIVGELASRERPQFLEKERRGDDGGAGIEGEAILPEHTGAPAGLLELFEHRDAIALGAKPDGGGQPAQTAADDGRMGPSVRGLVSICKHVLSLDRVNFELRKR